MSSDNAISVRNLSKCYQIYSKPSDRLKQSIFPRVSKLLGRKPSQYFREFWALKDISFDVGRGETVGIIGRNGSGKSTLLQLICDTLAPTSGSINVNGRVAALLELGAGFNPEFTGKENVYLNSSLLGLSKAQIDARYEDIIAFADIGEFIDQPVKTFSSGMYVRLAFAVSVHVNADILIVDEALAVGDAFFTQKCTLRIKKMLESGLTLLFVSHDLNSVKSLCSKAILLDHGNLRCTGDTNKVVETYYGESVQKQQELLDAPGVRTETTIEQARGNSLWANNENFTRRAQFQRLQNGKAEFLNVLLLDDRGREVEQLDFGQTVTLQMVIRANVPIQVLALAYHIRDKNGFDLVYSDTGIDDSHIANAQAGDLFIIDWTFKAALREGNYTIATMLSIPLDLEVGEVQVCDFVPIAVQVKVGRGRALPIYGAVCLDNKISCRSISAGSVSMAPGTGEPGSA